MRFKAIYDENDPNSLKLTQKVASTRNLRSNSKGILINANSNRKRLKNKLGIQNHLQLRKMKFAALFNI